ncbi:hypothetical protein ACFVWN_01115 [Nocardiopsis flavescens]|uniref:hypothetical protein n=1 Tax=Nocardiopsis flavescens TaxID=758803 RepID=UPI003647D7CF
MVYNDDVLVTGAISAGNIHHTTVRITPEPGVPTSVEITGLALRGTGPVQAQATAHTSVPGLRVLEVSVSSVTPQGCLVWIYRTNAVETDISVTLWRDP